LYAQQISGVKCLRYKQAKRLTIANSVTPFQEVLTFGDLEGLLQTNDVDNFGRA